MSYLSDLSGKRVLITGASTGIGAAVARGFGECGATVGVHYHSSKEKAEAVVAEIRAAGGRAEALGADVSDSAAVAPLIDNAIAVLGGLDVLINNAGGLVRRAPTLEMVDDLLDQVVDLNIRSVVMATKAVVPHFLEQGHGNIINTGSVAAHNGGGPGASVYASAKAFVHDYTRSVAKEFARQKIRVNCVAPGLILTPFHGDTPKSMIESVAQSIPLGRVGEPEDLVGIYLFLASDRMSGYITGQSFDVNGGYLMPG